MNDELDVLIKKATEAEKSEDAIRFSQAAVNVAHARHMACLTAARVAWRKGEEGEGRNG